MIAIASTQLLREQIAGELGLASELDASELAWLAAHETQEPADQDEQADRDEH